MSLVFWFVISFILLLSFIFGMTYWSLKNSTWMGLKKAPRKTKEVQEHIASLNKILSLFGLLALLSFILFFFVYLFLGVFLIFSGIWCMVLSRQYWVRGEYRIHNALILGTPAKIYAFFGFIFGLGLIIVGIFFFLNIGNFL
ncbi:hypothetical protein HZA98_04960 [Candidatus Woesearchaeota archaeon]|nr:hypothetical protein [Candidatus Woesearchaeota archaeon]